MRPIFVTASCLIVTLAFALPVLKPNQASQQRPLPAPTYYLVSEVNDCEPDPNYIEFRGASNLPAGAVLTATVADFEFDAWKPYSEEVDVTVDEHGFFSGKILPKSDMRLRHNLILLVDFTPFRPKQSPSVLAAIGKKGEKLAHVDDVVLKGIERPAVNPQLVHFSGDLYGLHSIARVPHCGEK